MTRFTHALLICLAINSIAFADDKTIESRLKSQKVNLSFDGTPLADVALFLQDISGISFALDPESKIGEEQVTLRLKGISLKNALALCVAAAEDGSYVISQGFVVLGKESKLARYKNSPFTKPTADADKELLAKFKKRKVTLNFNETPWKDVAAFLKAITGLKFVIPAKLADAKVSIKAKDKPLHKVLCFLALKHKAKLTFKDGTYKLTQKGK